MKNVRITIFFGLFIMASFLALAGRCFYLQYFKSQKYIDACITQQQSFRNLQPQRGVILDCRGRVLAASNKVQTIFAEPRVIKDAKTTSSELAPIVDIGAHIICQQILESNNPGFVRIKTNANAGQCNAARKIHGIGIQSEWQRHYPMGRLAANLVGFTSHLDNRGLEGVELKYDKELSGSAALNIFLADAHRRPIRAKQQDGVLTNGVGIILTIDATIQQFTRDQLIKQYMEYEAESAVAIVAEPRSGAILAMISLPDFDPADRTTDPNNFRSRAITDWYEPGSILKPIAVAIALDAGVVNRTEKIFCENGSYSGKGFGRIGEYRRGFGDLTVREILVNSSNIGMAKIGQRLGKDRLYDGLKLFGFGRKTGIELPGEVDGLLRPPDTWTGYSITRIPFGQEICVTGMQLIRAFCILANGGRLVRPFLVRAIVDNDGKITELKRPPPPVGHIIKPEVAEWVVREAMTGVVNEGTGKRAQLEKWQLFGKTGTANIASSDTRGYSENEFVASFIAGAPVDEPAIVVLVSIRKPNRSLGKGYTGGVIAAPVAAKIIEKTLTYLGVKPDSNPSIYVRGRNP